MITVSKLPQLRNNGAPQLYVHNSTTSTLFWASVDGVLEYVQFEVLLTEIFGIKVQPTERIVWPTQIIPEAIGKRQARIEALEQ